MIGRGVRTGARMPIHDFTMKPGMPASANVGTCGSAVSRVSPGAAIAFSLPLLICARTLPGGWNEKST